MKHISINVSKEIKNILPDTLCKDLQDHEDICPVCHGLGVVLDNNVYGIKGDTSEVAKNSRFPYNHQSLQFCPNCFNGVIKLCEYCSKPLKKGSTQCGCTGYKLREEIAKEVRYQKTIDKAKEIDINDIDSDIWFYDENMDKFFPDIDSFVEYYKGESLEAREPIEIPNILWLTEKIYISMDAERIIEDACDELYEGAYDSISMLDMKELQFILDKWCNKQTDTKTYYPDYSKYIKVKNEWFD